MRSVNGNPAPAGIRLTVDFEVYEICPQMTTKAIRTRNAINLRYAAIGEWSICLSLFACLIAAPEIVKVEPLPRMAEAKYFQSAGDSGLAQEASGGSAIY